MVATNNQNNRKRPNSDQLEQLFTKRKSVEHEASGSTNQTKDNLFERRKDMTTILEDWGRNTSQNPTFQKSGKI